MAWKFLLNEGNSSCITKFGFPSFSNVSLLCLCFGTATSSKLEHVPVKDVVVSKALAVEKVPEQLPEVTENKDKVNFVNLLKFGFTQGCPTHYKSLHAVAVI